MSINRASTQHQQSINDFHHSICDNPKATLLHLRRIEVLPAFMGNMLNVNMATPQHEHQHSVKRASTEHQ